MKTTTLIAAIIASCAVTAMADVPACVAGSPVDGEEIVGPWSSAGSCEKVCYFEETDPDSDNYQMQCKGSCNYQVPACATSVCPSGNYTCSAK